MSRIMGYSLFLPQSFYGLQHGGFASGIQPRGYTSQRQTANRQPSRHGNELRWIETARTLDRAHRRHQARRDPHSDETADESEKNSLQEKLEQDAAVGRAQRFAEADFMRPLGDRDQHNVDNADRAQRQRDHAHAAQENTHGVKNRADHFRLLDGVPAFESVIVAIVKTVIASNDFAYFQKRQSMLRSHAGLVIDE